MTFLFDPTVLHGDCRDILATLEPGSVQLSCSSPPYYGQRRYGADPREIGYTGSLDAYLAEMVAVYRLVHRALDDDGTCWIVIGDKAAGSGGAGGDHAPDGSKGWIPKYGSKLKPGIPPGQWCMVPHRLALALQADGWLVRSTITWDKSPNLRPEDPKHANRPLVATEVILLLAKRVRHRWHPTRLVEPADVWHIAPRRGPKAVRHFAPYPVEIPRRAILAASEFGDTILDPFGGSHSTAQAAHALGRRSISIELYEPEGTPS